MTPISMFFFTLIYFVGLALFMYAWFWLIQRITLRVMLWKWRREQSYAVKEVIPIPSIEGFSIAYEAHSSPISQVLATHLLAPICLYSENRVVL